MTTVENIRAVCAELADFLAEKNAAYGDSAAAPLRVFARGVDAEAGIHVRIDDKLSRLARGSEYVGDDTVKDLAGYLILLLAIRREKAGGEPHPFETPPVPCQTCQHNRSDGCPYMVFDRVLACAHWEAKAADPRGTTCLGCAGMDHVHPHARNCGTCSIRMGNNTALPNMWKRYTPAEGPR